MSQKEYCRRHGLAKSTLGWWSSRLKRQGGGGSQLVEVGRAAIKEEHASGPIELVVEGRYLLRLWRGTDRAQLSEVLSVLEDRL